MAAPEPPTYPFFIIGSNPRVRFPKLINDDSTLEQIQAELLRLGQQYEIAERRKRATRGAQSDYFDGVAQQISDIMGPIEDRRDEMIRMRFGENKKRSTINKVAKNLGPRFARLALEVPSPVVDPMNPNPDPLYPIMSNIKDYLGTKYKSPTGRGVGIPFVNAKMGRPDLGKRSEMVSGGESLRRRMEREREMYPDREPRLGGMILDQSKKHFNRFKVSETGYGVEVDNLITLVSKKTLIELMKGMYTPVGFSVSRLRKMSKGEVADYFMKNFAEGPIDRRKTKERNRPETKLKLGTPLDNASKYAASRQNSLEVKKRPRPVRTGISL